MSHALITASENVTYGEEEEGPIYTIQSSLPVYFRLLGQGRSRMQTESVDGHPCRLRSDAEDDHAGGFRARRSELSSPDLEL